MDSSKVSLLETGKKMPSVREICILSLIYGKSFESLFGGIFADARIELRERLASIPKCPERWLGRYNRQVTLNSLADQLEDLTNEEYGNAA